MSLKQVFASGKFAITAEVGPMKGTDTTKFSEVASVLQGRVDAVNATDQQSAVMRLGSMATCYLLQQHGLEAVLQMSCRDRNRIALQSDLLSAWVMGIHNVLALTGDIPESGDHPQAKPVFDLDSIQLLQVINGLNAGCDMAGNQLKGKPDFFSGAVVNPVADTEANLELQISRMEKKIEAGAIFFQTQAIYEPAKFYKFMKRIEQFHVPVMAGVIPLKSVEMANFMNKNVAGIHVPELLIEKMTSTHDKTQTGLQITADIIKQVKDICQGIHIMAIGWEKNIPEILDLAGI